jgi:hypothetical protein
MGFGRLRKAQAAIEFLMTYGWALLIVVGVIGIIFASGIFNRPAPPECFVHPDLPCEAAAVFQKSTVNYELMFVFRNNQGGIIKNVFPVESELPEVVEGSKLTSTGPYPLMPFCLNQTGGTEISQGSTARCVFKYTSDHGDLLGENIKFRFTFEYTDEMDVIHITSGHIQTTVTGS